MTRTAGKEACQVKRHSKRRTLVKLQKYLRGGTWENLTCSCVLLARKVAMALISASLRTQINVSKVSTFSAWEWSVIWLEEVDLAFTTWCTGFLSRGFIQLHSSWHVSILVISCSQWSLNWVLRSCQSTSRRINDGEFAYWELKKDSHVVVMIKSTI